MPAAGSLGGSLSRLRAGDRDRARRRGCSPGIPEPETPRQAAVPEWQVIVTKPSWVVNDTVDGDRTYVAVDASCRLTAGYRRALTAAPTAGPAPTECRRSQRWALWAARTGAVAPGSGPAIGSERARRGGTAMASRQDSQDVAQRQRRLWIGNSRKQQTRQQRTNERTREQCSKPTSERTSNQIK